MAEEVKYYWLKLKRDFFKRHDIRIIEEMPNGKDYILFYLKLLLESIDHAGALRFSDTVPYNEQMLSIVTNTNIDIVRAAMKLFVDLNMMTICDDKTIYMTEVEKLIGHESKWAGYKREEREKLLPKTPILDNVQCLSKKCPTDKDKEIRDYSNNIYTAACASVFDHWNAKNIIKHRELTEDIAKAIEKALKVYPEEAIKTYIDRYAKVVQDETYFFAYKWTLKDFLTRKDGIASFTDEGSKWVSYTTRQTAPAKGHNVQPKESSFKADDFFAKAIARTYGEGGAK
jgi:predicted phage replisome organizer